MTPYSASRRQAYVLMLDCYLAGVTALPEIVHGFFQLRRGDIDVEGQIVNYGHELKNDPVWVEIHSDLFWACEDVNLYPELGYVDHEIDETEFRVRVTDIRRRMAEFEALASAPT